MTEIVLMPCESQPRWHCLERVMRYRLTRQLTDGQIASVIQNKHGRHTTHRLDGTRPRNRYLGRENRPTHTLHSTQRWCGICWAIYFCIWRVRFLRQIFEMCRCHLSTFVNRWVSNVYTTCLGVVQWRIERRQMLYYTDRALDMEMSCYWFQWSAHLGCRSTSNTPICCLSCCGHGADY